MVNDGYFERASTYRRRRRGLLQIAAYSLTEKGLVVLRMASQEDFRPWTGERPRPRQAPTTSKRFITARLVDLAIYGDPPRSAVIRRIGRAQLRGASYKKAGLR